MRGGSQARGEHKRTGVSDWWGKRFPEVRTEPGRGFGWLLGFA